MQLNTLEKVLYWIVRVCAYALPFTLLIVIDNFFFPFISGKNFLFRIIVELMTAGWLGLLILDFKKYWPKWGPVSAALTVFVGAIFLSAVFGVDFQRSMWSNFERMEGLVTHLHLLALFFVLAGTFRTRREWFIFFGVSIAASFLIAFYGLLEHTGEIVSVADSYRIIATLGNPLYVAAYLSFHIFLVAFLLFYVRSAPLKWFLGAVMLFELAVFFLTGARGAFVGMLAGTGIILLSLLFAAGSVKKRAILAAVIVAMLSVPFLLNVFQDRAFIKNNDLLLRFANISLEAGKARFTLWGVALEAFKERPVLGWGVENFDIPFAKHYDPRMFGQEAWFDRTHNMPLQWLVDGGVVGFLAYLLLLLSIVPALVRGVRQDVLEKRSTFVFIGMFAAYLIQLLFVFDTLSTYLMLIMMLGFLHVASRSDAAAWLRTNSFLPATDGSESGDSVSSEKLSRKELREMQRRMNKTQDQDRNYATIPTPVASAVAGVFVATFGLMFMIDIRPIMANQTLLESFGLFREQRFGEAEASFKKALELARGTIGTSEIREHLVFNTYNLFSSPELLKKPEGQAIYLFAVEEMKKQIAGNSEKYPKIKHNILLAQLYHQNALATGNREVLGLAMEQYDKAIQFAPNYLTTYPVAANLLAQTGNIGKAIMMEEKAVALLTTADKYETRIFYSRPLFYVAAGRYDDAYNALAEISAKYSGPERRLDAGMMDNIIMATRSQGPAAIPFLEKLYLLDNSIVSTAMMLAQINGEFGRVDQARFYANEALKHNPAIKDQVDAFLKELDATAAKNSKSKKK